MEKNRLILDTSAYSAILKGTPSIRFVLQQTDEIFLNPVILGELFVGFSLGKDEKKNRNILQDFLSSPRVTILLIDQETSERYAAIRKYLRLKGTPIPTNDLWIAASAMQFGLKVLTTDRHFLKIPQIIAEIFDSPEG